ncbi:unnamed protein product, partial [Laminaria digitata]
RGTETEDALTRRLANAKAEMDFGTAPGNFEEVRGASEDLEGGVSMHQMAVLA